MTTHLDEGTLQAFLDEELPAGERASAAEHMLVCEQCRGAHDDLRRAGALFSYAVSLLDGEAAPAAATAVGRGEGRARRGGIGSLVKAAGLILVVAAAASAGVPGSPVRVWVERIVARDDPEPAAAPVDAPDEEPAPPVAMPVGLAVVPSGDTLDIVLEDVSDVTIRLRRSGAEQATVSAAGSAVDPAFESGRGRIALRGASGGELIVELPETLTTARLLVNGRLYADVVHGRMEARVPAQERGGDLVWP